jgi:aromatic ring-opening dioxygenase catalytic subunit (LigB family)
MLCKAAAHDHGTVDFDGFPPELKDIMYEYMHL